MPHYVDINKYIKEKGRVLSEDENSMFFNGIQKLFDNYLSAYQELISGIEIKLFEIENKHFNASVLNVGSNQYAIFFRAGIESILLEEFGQNYEIFEEYFDSFDDKETVMTYYNLFIYVYLLGHELGHVIYRHFALDDKINTIDEVGFNMFNTIYNKDIIDYSKKDKTFFLELNADMMGAVFIIMQYENILNKYKEDKSLKYDGEALFRIIISSLVVVFNYLTKVHPLECNYPHPMTRISFISKIIKEKFESKGTNLGFDINKVIDNQLTKVFSFQMKHKIFNYVISDNQIFNNVTKETIKVDEEILKFIKQIKNYTLIKGILTTDSDS